MKEKLGKKTNKIAADWSKDPIKQSEISEILKFLDGKINGSW